ncbi:MAG: sigma-70 family RNA polymerase sigma factor [Candidatus Muirbacterium halophilum]|nr:sigma-70 family RNA polymerase sigma factor [Candidatus Muirbacterium halophilum]
MLDEKEIVHKILDGDIELFEEIVNEYKRPLFIFLYRFCFNDSLCEEIIQQTFIKAFRFLDKVDCEKGLKNWLYQIARNTFYDTIKKEKRNNDVAMEDVEFFLASSDISPECEVINKGQINVVIKVLYELPDKYREIMILRHLEEKTYEEISEILDIPVNTVKIRIFRAREKMRIRLEEGNDFEL